MILVSTPSTNLLAPLTSPAALTGLVMETSASRSWLTVGAAMFVLSALLGSLYAPLAVTETLNEDDALEVLSAGGVTNTLNDVLAFFASDGTALAHLTVVGLVKVQAAADGAPTIEPVGTVRNRSMLVAVEVVAVLALLSGIVYLMFVSCVSTNLLDARETSPAAVMAPMVISASRSTLTAGAEMLVLFALLGSTYPPVAVTWTATVCDAVEGPSAVGVTEKLKVIFPPAARVATAGPLQVIVLTDCEHPACATKVTPAGTLIVRLMSVAVEFPKAFDNGTL